MKKFVISLMICIGFVMFFAIQVYAAPFSDGDYLREDFSVDDYRKYADFSTDDDGSRWDADADVIMSDVVGTGIVKDGIFIDIPESAQILGTYSFYKRNLPQEAFDFSKLNNLKFIDESALWGNKIFRIDLSQTSVVRIGTNAFYPHYCFESIFIAPKTLKRIDNVAFGDAPFEKITLNEGLEYIGNSVFKGSYNHILIPSTVKYIGQNAFENNGKTYRVYRNSYAEQWCKQNGIKYIYEEDVQENLRSLKGKTMKLGPLTVEDVAFCYIAEVRGEQVYKIYITNGGSITTDYDNMNLYLTSNIVGKQWEITEGKYGLTDNFYSDSTNSPLKICIFDKGITATKSTKQPDGTWTKGLKWTFAPNPANYGAAYNIVAKRDGREYRYYIFCENEGDKYGYLPKNATLTDSSVYVNGKMIQFSAYNIEDNNYFKLRDVAMALNGTSKQFNVTWNEEAGQINLISSTKYMPVGGELETTDKVKILADDSYVQILKDGYNEIAMAYLIDGNNYFKLRDLGRIFGFGVEWDGNTNSILINTEK